MLLLKGLFLFFGVSVATPVLPADVLDLTSDNFLEVVAARPYVLVAFQAPWCGHCKVLEPEYLKAASQLALESSDIVLAKVDASADTELGQTYGIRGYPTLKFFRAGVPEEYTGDRSADGIVRWLKQMTGPPLTFISDESEIPPLLQQTKEPVFIARVRSRESSSVALFENVATENRRIGRFYLLEDRTLSNDVIVRYHPVDKDTTAPFSMYNEPTVNAWVKRERFPYLAPITAENYQDYMACPLTVVWLLCSPHEYHTLQPTIVHTSRLLRHMDYTFVWLNTNAHGDFAQRTFQVSAYPSIVLQLKDSRQFVLRSDDGRFSVESILHFVQHVQTPDPSRRFNPLTSTTDGDLLRRDGSLQSGVDFGSSGNVSPFEIDPFPGYDGAAIDHAVNSGFLNEIPSPRDGSVYDGLAFDDVPVDDDLVSDVPVNDVPKGVTVDYELTGDGLDPDDRLGLNDMTTNDRLADDGLAGDAFGFADTECETLPDQGATFGPTVVEVSDLQ